MGGNVWIVARKDNMLFMLHGTHVHALHDDGLQGARWAMVWGGGPRGWPWGDIQRPLNMEHVFARSTMWIAAATKQRRTA
jgi:hypothetical protein